MEYKYLTEKVDEVKPVLSVELNIACANANLVRRYIRNTLNGKNISNEKIIACCEGRADGFGRYSSKNGIVQKFTFRYLEGDEKNAFIEERNLAIKREEQKKKYLEEHNCKLYTWRKPNGDIFYVGQGKGKRYQAIGKYDRHEDFFKILKEYPGCYPKIEKDELTKEEAEKAEKEFIKDLIENKGYGIDNFDLNLNKIDSGDHFLINKTCGGHNEFGSVSHKDGKAHANRSNGQIRYNKSEEGKKQKSQISKNTQSRQDVKNKKSKSMKKFYEEHGVINSSNSKKVSDRTPDKIANKGMCLHCIELNKTFLAHFQVLPYMMKNFGAYIKGHTIVNKINKSSSGVHCTGAIEFDNIVVQLSWREATEEEKNYELARYKEEYKLNKKAGDIIAETEAEFVFEDYLELLDEMKLLGTEGKNEEYEPKKKLEQKYGVIMNYVGEEEKLDVYPEDIYQLVSISEKKKIANSSFQHKLNYCTQIYCETLDKSFICADEAKKYIFDLTGENLNAEIIQKRSTGYPDGKNFKYGDYNNGKLVWKEIEKNSQKHEDLYNHYNEIAMKCIQEKNKEIEENRLKRINELKRIIKDLENGIFNDEIIFDLY